MEKLLKFSTWYEVALKFAIFMSYIWSIITGWILKKYEVAIIRLSLQNKDTFLARALVWIKNRSTNTGLQALYYTRNGKHIRSKFIFFNST